MKFAAATLLAVLGVANAGNPQLSVRYLTTSNDNASDWLVLVD